MGDIWFNMKMSSYQYRKSHCEDKTIVRSSYLHNGISYTGKKSSLYWIRALGPFSMYGWVRSQQWEKMLHMISCQPYTENGLHQIPCWWWAFCLGNRGVTRHVLIKFNRIFSMRRIGKQYEKTCKLHASFAITIVSKSRASNDGILICLCTSFNWQQLRKFLCCKKKTDISNDYQLKALLCEEKLVSAY